MTLEIQYEGHFSQFREFSGNGYYDLGIDIPGSVQQASSAAKDVQAAAKAAGIDIPNVPGAKELIEELGVQIPGVPFDPNLIVGVFTGDIDVADVAKEAAIQSLNLVVPGIGLPLRAAWPYIEKGGQAIIDVATGQKVKRDRRRRNWKGIRSIFEYTMDSDPLLFYNDGKPPSAAFIRKFKQNMNDPGVWQKQYYQRYHNKNNREVPYWVNSKTALKLAYEGSGISGKRTNVSFLDRSVKEAEQLKMLKTYLEIPGKQNLFQQAMLKKVKDAKAAAEKRKKLQQSRQRIDREQGLIMAKSLEIAAAMEGELVKQVLAHPELALKKIGGKVLGIDAYGIPVALALQKKFPGITKQVNAVVKGQWKNRSKDILKKHPELGKAIFAKAAQLAKVPASTSAKARAIAADPTSKQATEEKKKLTRKERRLKRAARKKARVARKAIREANRLLRQNRKLRQQLAKQPANKVLEKAAASTLKTAVIVNKVAEAGEQIAKAESASGDAVKKYQQAVASGNITEAKKYASSYYRHRIKTRLLQRRARPLISLARAA